MMQPTDRTPPLPRLLSARELFEQTGVPRSTWYSLCARGHLPHVRIAGSIRVDERDVRAYLARGYRAPHVD